MKVLNVVLLAVLLTLGATAGCATAPIAAGPPSPTGPTSRTEKTVPRVLVTAQQLIDRGHRLEIAAGTEVVWADGQTVRPAVKRGRVGDDLCRLGVEHAHVAVDTVRAGEGDLVYLVGSREAALALETWFVPVDAAIVGIVDDVDVARKKTK